jgi:hypothetical protein
MPPSSRGYSDNQAHPEVCCTTYIATYCDVSTKKIHLSFLETHRGRWIPSQPVQTDHLYSAFAAPLPGIASDLWNPSK